jgi:hypothetical protein
MDIQSIIIGAVGTLVIAGVLYVLARCVKGDSDD